jgi:hypothetical protein
MNNKKKINNLANTNQQYRKPVTVSILKIHQKIKPENYKKLKKIWIKLKKSRKGKNNNWMNKKKELNKKIRRYNKK